MSQEADIAKALKELISFMKGEKSKSSSGLQDELEREQDPDKRAKIQRYLEQEKETLGDINKQYTDLFENLENIEDVITRNGTLTEKETERVKEQLNLMMDRQQITKDYAETLRDLAENSKLGDKDATKRFLQEMKFLKQGRKDWKKLEDTVMNYHKKVEEALGVSSSIFKDLAFEADSLGRGFQAQTGFSNDFRDSMLEINKAAIDSGVSMKDASAALGAMSTNLSTFDPLAKQANETTATQIALLGKLGVNANTAASSMDFLERSMNMGRNAAAGMTMELATFADGMGVTSEKMMSDFQSVSGSLAKHGSDMVKVFKNISAMAKATGIEISTLVGLTDKFNQFDTAADSVAKLNAVLGTQMSTIEMMAMDTDEQLDYLRDNLQMTVGSFNNLDKFTQQYIATSMGFKDVGEAGRFLNMSAKEQDEYRQRAEESAKTQEEIAKITQDFIPIMERLKLSMAKAALAMKPLIDAFMLFFDGIFALDEILGNKLLPTIAMSILLYTGLMTAVGMYKVYAGAAAFIQSLEIAWLSLNKAMGIVGLVAVGLALLFTSDLSDSVKVMAVGIGILAASFYFLQGAMSWVGAVFGLLITLFGTQINPLFVNAFAHMAIGVLAMGLALQFLNRKALIGATVLMGLFMAFSYFFGGLVSTGQTLDEIAIGFAALAIGIAIAGKVLGNPQVALGVAALSLALLALGGSVVLVGYGMGLIADSLVKISEISNIAELANGILSIGGAIVAMGMAFINPLVTVGILLFVATIMALGSAVEQMGSGFEKMVESLSAVKGIMSELDGVVTNSFVAVTQEGGKTNAVIANGEGMTALLGGNISVDVKIPEIKSPEVRVFLDGEELKKLVKDVMRQV
jgi:hypothetical protein